MMCLPRTQALDGCGQHGYPVHTHPSLGLGQPRPHLLIPSGVTVGRRRVAFPQGQPVIHCLCGRVCGCVLARPLCLLGCVPHGTLWLGCSDGSMGLLHSSGPGCGWLQGCHRLKALPGVSSRAQPLARSQPCPLIPVASRTLESSQSPCSMRAKGPVWEGVGTSSCPAAADLNPRRT